MKLIVPNITPNTHRKPPEIFMLFLFKLEITNCDNKLIHFNLQKSIINTYTNIQIIAKSFITERHLRAM